MSAVPSPAAMSAVQDQSVTDFAQALPPAHDVTRVSGVFAASDATLGAATSMRAAGAATAMSMMMQSNATMAGSPAGGLVPMQSGGRPLLDASLKLNAPSFESPGLVFDESPIVTAVVAGTGASWGGTARPPAPDGGIAAGGLDPLAVPGSPGENSCASATEGGAPNDIDVDCPALTTTHPVIDTDHGDADSAATPASATMTTTPGSSSTRRAGATIGGFSPGSTPTGIAQTPHEILGRGSFGTVYRVALAGAPGGAAARKVLPVTAGPGDTAGTDAALRTELRVAKRLHRCANPRLLRIFATHVGATEATIDMELLDAGSLARLAPLSSEATVAAMAQQLLLGLQALHDEVGVLHRDLKLQNILASRDGRVKLVGFGCAALGPDPARRRAGNAAAAGSDDNNNDNDHGQPAAAAAAAAAGPAALVARDQQGTIAQMAPERLRGEPHGPASDVWSLGVALAELATGAHPFLPRDEAAAASTERFWALAAVLKHTGTAAECEAATEAAVAAALAPCSAELRAFLGAMLRAPAASRASVAELLAHPFVASVGCDAPPTVNTENAG